MTRRLLAEKLSLREKECLVWIALGKSSWDIGAILGISENTANFHIKNAMRKLHTHSRAAAAIKAVQFGIIELPSHWADAHPNSVASRGKEGPSQA